MSTIGVVDAEVPTAIPPLSSAEVDQKFQWEDVETYRWPLCVIYVLNFFEFVGHIWLVIQAFIVMLTPDDHPHRPVIPLWVIPIFLSFLSTSYGAFIFMRRIDQMKGAMTLDEAKQVLETLHSTAPEAQVVVFGSDTWVSPERGGHGPAPPSYVVFGEKGNEQQFRYASWHDRSFHLPLPDVGQYHALAIEVCVSLQFNDQVTRDDVASLEQRMLQECTNGFKLMLFQFRLAGGEWKHTTVSTWRGESGMEERGAFKNSCPELDKLKEQAELHKVAPEGDETRAYLHDTFFVQMPGAKQPRLWSLPSGVICALSVVPILGWIIRFWHFNKVAGGTYFVTKTVSTNVVDGFQHASS